jgi:hypothetical protein
MELIIARRPTSALLNTLYLTRPLDGAHVLRSMDVIPDIQRPSSRQRRLG